MDQSCWACGQRNDDGSTHCVNPACGLPVGPAGHRLQDIAALPVRPSYLRVLVLPATITLVIVLSAVHALLAPMHGPLANDHASNGLLPLSSPQVSAGVGTPTDGPLIFPLPVPSATARPGPSPASKPSTIHNHDDGPVSGAYYMKSLNGGCFDIGYTADQTPMLAQRPCSTAGPLARFDLQALGSGQYRMSAVPQRGINAGQALCVSSTASGGMVVLDACETTRADQVFLFVETSDEWYQIRINGRCLTAMGKDARPATCGSSQAQRFTFTPIN